MPPFQHPVSQKKPGVFISPLHWGLGHASRCIPIIKKLEENQFEVTIGANAPLRNMMEAELKSPTFCKVPELRVVLGKNRITTLAMLILQAFKIPGIIRTEQEWIRAFCEKHSPGLILSDNRYGFYHPEIKSILITHQLNLPGLPLFLSRVLMKRLFRHFHEIWVPDLEPETRSLAGKLSLNHFSHLNIRYIGPLTRFQKQTEPGRSSHLLFLISGPEPQRSRFEDLAYSLAEKIHQKCIVVRGSSATRERKVDEHIMVYDLADAGLLQNLLKHASLVICRPGYSSIMDLLAFDAPAIFIPTPGQFEQEYLSKHLHQKYGFWGLNSEANEQEILLAIETVTKMGASKRDIEINCFESMIRKSA